MASSACQSRQQGATRWNASSPKLKQRNCFPLANAPLSVSVSAEVAQSSFVWASPFVIASVTLSLGSRQGLLVQPLRKDSRDRLLRVPVIDLERMLEQAGGR